MGSGQNGYFFGISLYIDGQACHLYCKSSFAIISLLYSWHIELDCICSYNTSCYDRLVTDSHSWDYAEVLVLGFSLKGAAKLYVLSLYHHSLGTINLELEIKLFSDIYFIHIK